jgi:hypothetical protein
MWVQNIEVNNIVLLMNVCIIATLDPKKAVLIWGIPNLKNKGGMAKYFMKHLYKYSDVVKIIWYH